MIGERFFHWLERVLLGSAEQSFQRTGFIILRFLGLVYTAAFLSLALQVEPLIGSSGLLPAARFLPRINASFWTFPSLFRLASSDSVLLASAWFGVVLSIIMLCGYATPLLLTMLWILYLSFVQIGQIFYGYGWEMLLLEAGFLAIFLSAGAPRVVIWLMRWLCFRLYLGAGLIKIRGDNCWQDLSCLRFHFETQPIPNPLSWVFHQLPDLVLRSGVAFNHVVEVLAPFLLLIPFRPFRIISGLLFIGFQVILILSGNLSFLNWLTIAIALSCFDDRSLPRGIPRQSPGKRTTVKIGIVLLLSSFVLFRSIDPVLNLISPQQVMNRSYDPFYLVNTYGMFGSIGRERYEVILEGSHDGMVWQAIEFPCKPGNPLRMPCIVSPLQPRLDWQVWFAAMQDYAANPWLVHLIYKLLNGDPIINRLLEVNPFANQAPPKWIRAEYYRYRFTSPGEPGWWIRSHQGSYLPPLSLDNTSLTEFLRAHQLID